MRPATTSHWLWDRGDYAVTARDLHRLSVDAVRRLAPATGERVLDLGTGTGNAALLAADAGARTTGVDLATGLLDRAQQRARDAGLEVSFVRGDIHDLPFPDGAFDAALSVSACVLVPDPERTAEELVRVLRPGGRAVVMGWRADGDEFFGRMLRHFPVVDADLVDADPGWFGAAQVERLFAPLGATVEVHELPYGIGGEDAPSIAERMLRTHPVMVALREEGDDEAWETTSEDLRRMVAEEARPTEDGGVELPATALACVVRVDGGS